MSNSKQAISITENPMQKHLHDLILFEGIESEVNLLRKYFFLRRVLTPAQMQSLHCTCTQSLTGCERSLAVRVEIFTLLYFCQPAALFRKVRFSPTVVNYVQGCMHITLPNMSAYKADLVFLYQRDRMFKSLSDQAIAAAALVLADSP